MKSSDNSLYTKKELLSWINGILKIEVQTIEQLSNGAVFSQLLDIISPGVVRMQKVNWSAKLQHQSLANLKLVSTAMLALNIDKKFEVTRIAQKKTQDILELLQWFRKYFFDNHIATNSYDAIGRRKIVLTEKTSGQHRKSSQIYVKSKQQIQLKSQFFAKKQCEDIIKDNDIKNIIKKNKEIQKIVLYQTAACAEQKLQQIKKILLQKNQGANSNKNYYQLTVSTVRSEAVVHSNNRVKKQDNVKIQYVHPHDYMANLILKQQLSPRFQRKQLLEYGLDSGTNFQSRNKSKQEL